MNMSFFQAFLKKFQRRKNREQLYSTVQYWDAKAKETTGSSISMWENHALNHLYQQEVNAFLLDATGGEKPGRLLDMGCGTGRLSRFFAEKHWHVEAVDFSETTLNIARSIPHSGEIIWRKCSLLELDYHTEFDVAISWGVIVFLCQDSHVLAGFFRDVKQACKPGAKVILLEPIHNNFLHRVLKMHLKEFLAIMKAEGFEIESVKNMHFWPTRLLLCYINFPRWITEPVYHLGQWIMALFRYRCGGDYKAIIAKVPSLPTHR